MKSFRRIAAMFLVGVLALSMFTACGGSGGNSAALKLTKTPLVSGKAYLECEGTGVTMKMASNGTDTAAFVRGGVDAIYLQESDKIYLLFTTPKKYIEYTDNTSFQQTMALYHGILNVKDKLSEAKVAKTTINGTTYYSETITIDGLYSAKVSYCFDGENLVYIAVTTTEGTQYVKINKISGSFNENILKLETYKEQGYTSY